MNLELFEKTAMQRFLEYHRENPRVYELYKTYARQVRAAGHKRFSSEAIINRIRWHMSVETVGDSFKINNNYKSYYARKLVEEHPEFEGFFQFREQKSLQKKA